MLRSDEVVVRRGAPCRASHGGRRIRGDGLRRRRSRRANRADSRSDRIANCHGRTGVNRHNNTIFLNHVRTHCRGETTHCDAFVCAGTSGSSDARGNRYAHA